MRSSRKTISYYWNLWRFRMDKTEADRMHRITGKRYWVMKLLGKYYVLNNTQIKAMKAEGIFKKDLTIINLCEAASYYTK